MHNLHIVVTKTETGEDAVSSVRSSIDQWGDENNWRYFCGAVSQSGKIFDLGKGRWTPKSIYDVNDSFRCYLISNYDLTQGEETIQKYLADPNALKSADYYNLQCFAEFKREICDLKEYQNLEYLSNFDLFKHTLFCQQFDHFGVTHEFQKEEEGELWAVFVDMHS